MKRSIRCLLTGFISLGIPLSGGESYWPQEESAAIHRSSLLIHGIEIVNATSAANKDGIYTDFQSSLREVQARLEPLFLNREISRENLLLIRNEILGYFNDHKQHMVTVEIPEQDITAGVLTFAVSQARMGQVEYRGNNWYSARRVEKALSIGPGDPIDENELLNGIAWLNQNPFHYTELVMSPGQHKGETDLDIVTKDRFRLRVYAGADNTGVESTGTGRFYGGFTWGNAFFLDDLLTYQFTSNSTYDKFHSHLVNYLSFLPWQHFLTVYGGYSEIHPDVTDFKSHGKEAQASFRYKVPFKPLYTNFQHQLYFGFDYKYITSALFFVAELESPTPLMNSIVNITQEMLGYQLEYTSARHQCTFQVELFGSPAKWLPHQSNQAFSSFRSHATPRYFYGTIALGEIYTFASKYAISGLLRGQGSANTLIPSEQFVLGGYNTVRGYEESNFISDNGICANLELRSRPFTVFKKVKDALTFLAFMDYGWGYNFHAFDGITKTATLWGVGPGVRYTINPYVVMRADYGFKLHKVNFDDHTLGMWHVGATLSY